MANFIRLVEAREDQANEVWIQKLVRGLCVDVCNGAFKTASLLA